jgi:hypothetical protein
MPHDIHAKRKGENRSGKYRPLLYQPGIVMEESEIKADY